MTPAAAAAAAFIPQRYLHCFYTTEFKEVIYILVFKILFQVAGWSNYIK